MAHVFMAIAPNTWKRLNLQAIPKPLFMNINIIALILNQTSNISSTPFSKTSMTSILPLFRLLNCH